MENQIVALNNSVFGSENVIIQHINNSDLKTYFVGFDCRLYRYEDLVKVLMRAIVDFAFGYHSGIKKQYNNEILAEAAKSIYNIKDFSEVKWIYLDENSEISNEDLKNEKKYLRRGEFGELILHVLLRDFVKTIPLLSKIHFKDSDGVTVHGFDGIHIGPDISGKGESLYLGETKFYSRQKGNAGEEGVKDLIEDIKCHFKRDFLKREFSLISKKKYSYLPFDDYDDKNTVEEYKIFLERKKKWFEELELAERGEKKLEDFLTSITIPLLCTYESPFLSNHDSEKTIKFKEEYEKEMQDLKSLFDSELKKLKDEIGEPIKTNLNIILMLFPIPNKKELVKKLHKKLYSQQTS